MLKYPYRVFLRGINNFMLVYEEADHIQKLWDKIQKAIDKDDVIIFQGFDQRAIRVSSAICKASEIVAIDDSLSLEPLDIENALRNRKNMGDNSSKILPKEVGQSVSKRSKRKRK